MDDSHVFVYIVPKIQENRVSDACYSMKGCYVLVLLLFFYITSFLGWRYVICV